MYSQFWVFFPASGRIGKIDRNDVVLLAERFPSYIYFEASRQEVGK